MGGSGPKLDVINPGVVDRDMLIKMPQFSATTPHELPCPCARGMVLNKIEAHFPVCDAIPAIELKEKPLGEVDAEKMQLDLRFQRIVRNWQDTQTMAQSLQGTWDSAILTHCPRDFLGLLKQDINAEFLNR